MSNSNQKCPKCGANHDPAVATRTVQVEQDLDPTGEFLVNQRVLSIKDCYPDK